jgi:RNA polymerase sigma factor (sigma-70 family)
MIVAEQPTVWVWYGEEIRPTAITLRYGAAIRLQRGEPLVLETDLGGEVVLEVWQRPQWAVAAGQDQYGLWAAFEAGGVQQRMRWIPPGAFLMGSPPTEVGRFEDEGPQHRVRFAKGYWLGETPVTQALWRAVMKSNPSYHKSDELPVDQVSWDVCQKFVEHLNRSLVGLVTRLPIETEWERACRAGTTSPTWVNDAAALGERKVVPAGKLQPNPYGLYGMLGDVFEWCQDAANDTGQPYPYKLDLSDDPEPAAHGSSRVIRGGSWFGTPAAGGRSASRTAGKRELAMEGLGLRLAVSQELAPEEALPKSDEALLARWGAGDSGSGEVLFERYYDMVARFFRNKVSKDLALDLVQETFVSCVTNREKIRFPFRLHVFKIAYKVLETHLRKDFRGVLAVDDSVVMEITPHSDDRPNRLLLDALRRIPLEDQMVLELHYWENLALDQIAEAFEISAPAARGRLTRARWRLSETLKHISFDELDDAEFDDRIATTKELEELDELRKLRKLPKRF